MTTAVPSLLDDWVRATAPQQDQAAARERAETQRERVSRLKDPFMPVAMNDNSARAKETVLWEDDDTMVIVDAFAYGPKALVIPKQETLFPTDLNAEGMQRLGVISARVSDAFIALGAKGPSRMWINPPSALTVRQLHVHVQPGIARPGDAAAFYASMSEELQNILG